MADQRRELDQRPSPEALLEAARREQSSAGRLKIFVGAAPGVGKTYEMLQTARAKLKDGVDVVVGVVETHGRKETAGPARRASRSFRAGRIDYRGQSLEEMDLDAIIARRPRIVLVDELAHTNAPGSRHPKRYLDVEELLSHGIDVYYHRQHPAHREPQRRRRADHPCARARDGAGFRVRPRRRDRAGRSHPRRPDPAPQGRQGLRPQAGRAGARAFLLARQPDGAARARAAAHRRPGRRAAAHPHAGARDFRDRGRRASASWSASARTRAPPASCATPSGWPTGCTRRWTALYIETARSLQLSEEERDRIADTLRLAERARRRRRSPSRAARVASPTTSSAMPTPTTSPRSSSANRPARAGSRSCTARWCTIWSAEPAISACT